MDKENLKNEIAIELENLERLVKEMQQLTDKFVDQPDRIETRAAGSIVHDFYCGIEKTFEKIAIHIDDGIPKGEDWHTELLLQMARPVEGVRNALIKQDSIEILKEYLRFRHLFRHMYGYELKWERFKDLSISLSTIFNKFKEDLERFTDTFNNTTT